MVKPFVKKHPWAASVGRVLLNAASATLSITLVMGSAVTLGALAPYLLVTVCVLSGISIGKALFDSYRISNYQEGEFEYEQAVKDTATNVLIGVPATFLGVLRIGTFVNEISQLISSVGQFGLKAYSANTLRQKTIQQGSAVVKE